MGKDKTGAYASDLSMKIKAMKIKNIFLAFLLLGAPFASVIANEASPRLQKANTDLCDKASLQRGAGLFMNYCAGCHSLQYMRYKDMAKDIGIIDKSGAVLDKLVQDNLNFTTDRVTDPIQVALPKKDAEAWFGVAPPDLSLVARVRGKDWLYSYLRGFYEDPKRPWGVNNMIFPDVGMPHVLADLQGIQTAIFRTVELKDDEGKPFTKQVIDHLELTKPGALTEQQYNQAVADLVNFLDYAGEPHKLERKRLGVWVLLFLMAFTLFAYLLKREYWKDIH